MKRLQLLLAFLLFDLGAKCEEESKDRFLTLPKLAKCQSRFKEATYMGRNFFYSGHDPELKEAKLDWLDSRNTCRDRCMEPLSFETQAKFDFYKAYVEKNNISFFWTSGRLCDFEGCEGRWDLLPKRIKGWLWSANQVPISPTNKIPPGWSYQPWSGTGSRNRSQPDNAEFYLSQTSESCLGVLNNMYNDSVSWHDIACYHKARFICEDSEQLLKEAEEGDGSTAASSEPLPTVSSVTQPEPEVIADNPSQSVEKSTHSASTSTTKIPVVTTTTASSLDRSTVQRRNSRRKFTSETAGTTTSIYSTTSSTTTSEATEENSPELEDETTPVISSTSTTSTTTESPLDVTTARRRNSRRKFSSQAAETTSSTTHPTTTALTTSEANTENPPEFEDETTPAPLSTTSTTTTVAALFPRRNVPDPRRRNSRRRFRTETEAPKVNSDSEQAEISPAVEESASPRKGFFITRKIETSTMPNQIID